MQGKHVSNNGRKFLSTFVVTISCKGSRLKTRLFFFSF